MAYNRYMGNTGRRERVEEPGPVPAPPVQNGVSPPDHLPLPPPPPPPSPPPPPPPEGIGGELRALLRGLTEIRLETEDLLLLAVLYLLYRETKDEEYLLLMAGIVLF